MPALLNPSWQATALSPLMRLFANKGMATEQAARTALGALMLPGDVYRGNVSMYGADGRTNPQVINRSADLASMMTLGSGAIPAEANSLRAGMKIRDYKGQPIEAPRQFFRGENPGDARRISTGNKDWDSHLFVSSDREMAEMYGRHITQYEAAPDARILYEGTKDWQKIAGKQRKGENLLQYADRAAKSAKAAGYDAAWFKMQGNVGTAVFNPDKFLKLEK
jgi:hypothetical protein